MNDWPPETAAGTPLPPGGVPGEEHPAKLLSAGDYAAILRRRWLTLLVVPALAVIAMSWWAGQQPAVYLSQAELLVRPLSSDPLEAANAQRLVNVFTEAAVLSSSAVLERARPELESLELTQVQEQLSVEADDTAQVIRLLFEARTPELAQEGAAAIANAYLDHRNEQALDSISHMTSRLDERAKSLQEELETATRALAEATAADSLDEGEVAALRSQESLLSSQLSLVMNELASRSLIEPTAAEILRPATMEPTPIGMGRARLVLISLVGGLLIAGALALLRERLDHRVRNVDELGRLAKAPTAERLHLNARGKLVTRNNDLPGRRLAVFINRGAREQRTQVTAVTSATPSAITELVVDSLAQVLSDASAQVLVVGPRRSSEATILERYWKDGPERGSDRTSVPGVYGRAEYDDKDPAADLRDILVSGLDRYDHVLIAAPPVTDRADLLEYATSVDYVVLTVDIDRARVATIAETTGLLGQHGTAATVLVPVSSAHIFWRSAFGAVRRLRQVLSEAAQGVRSAVAAGGTSRVPSDTAVASPERTPQPPMPSVGCRAPHGGARHMNEPRWSSQSPCTGPAADVSPSTGREGRLAGGPPDAKGRPVVPAHGSVPGGLRTDGQDGTTSDSHVFAEGGS
jgi:capsular polysaccharide biosynthesis protein